MTFLDRLLENGSGCLTIGVQLTGPALAHPHRDAGH